MARKFDLGFTTLQKEVVIDNLPITGEIPAWLMGTLVRNGPAKFEVGERKLRHWFDGFAMLHKFSFQRGVVSYANKFLESKAYRYAEERGTLGYSEFATDPCRSIFKRFAQEFFPKPTDNANVNVSKIAEHFTALTEIPLPIEFDLDTLKTVGVHNYSDALKGNLTTAHPHYDFEHNEATNYLTRFSLRSTYNVYRIPAGSNTRQVIGSVPVAEPSYMHSFGITKNYVVLVEYPFVINPLNFLLSKKPFIENFKWKPEKGTTFLVIDRKNGNVKGRYMAEPFFAFHHVNAFEHVEGLMIDVVGYPDVAIVHSLYLNALRGEVGKDLVSAGQLRRYHIAWKDAAVSYETIVPHLIELPRINYKIANMNEYQFVYGVGSHQDHPEDFLDRLLKVDVQGKTVKIWQKENCYPGEPVFVPAPGAKDEDEGVILSIVLDVKKENSFLLILDASSFGELAIADVPHHIPFGLHGQYFG